MDKIQCVADLQKLAKEQNKALQFVGFTYLDQACSKVGKDYRIFHSKIIYCFDEHEKFIKTRKGEPKNKNCASYKW